MTHRELILDCLRAGLEGEKVDYQWEKREDQAVAVKFEDGDVVLVTVQDVTNLSRVS